MENNGSEQNHHHRAEDFVLDKELKELKIEFGEQLLERLRLLEKRPISEGERKKERKGHLSHSLNVEKICLFLLEKIKTKKLAKIDDKLIKKIRVAALLHDVGKTGPANANENEQKAVMDLFSFFEDEKLSQLSIEEAVNKHAEEKDKKFILENLPKGDDVECLKKEDLMKKVYQSHIHNTAEILKKYGFKHDIIYLAASHHSMGNNFKYEEVADKRQIMKFSSELLELCDFYEAAAARSKKSHDEIVKMMKEKFSTNKKQEIDDLINLFAENSLLMDNVRGKI
ncbi:MAG: HD domain-containing protein [Patescibacteria group bacterium]